MFDELDRLAGLGAFQEMIARAAAALPSADDDTRLELHHYLSWAWFELGDLARALAEARLADDPLDESKALFHLWHFDDARTALLDCGDDAEANWYRALVAEFTGGNPQPALGRAIAQEPERYRMPTRLNNEEVDAIVHAVLRAPPAALAWIFQEAIVEVLAHPRPHPDVDPLSLGLYIGSDLASRSHEDGVRMPPPHRDLPAQRRTNCTGQGGSGRRTAHDTAP